MSSPYLVTSAGIVIDTQHNHYIVNIVTPEKLEYILQVAPHVYRTPHAAGTYVVFPATKDARTILKNIGVDITGLEPFHWTYQVPLINGEFQAMAHQLVSAAFCTENPRAYNTSTMRTGKTASSVLAADYLQSVAYVPGSCLVLTTVSTLFGVWQNTIAKTLPHKEVVVIYDRGGKQKRLKHLRTPAHFYITNYDSVKLLEAEFLEMVNAGLIGCVIVDELTHYRNVSSGLWKSANRVINGKNPVPYVWGLTGTPGERPQPYYGMVNLITPSHMSKYTKKSWEEATLVQWGKSRWQVAPKKEAKDLLFQVMQPTIRFDKKDVMELPPVDKAQAFSPLTTEQEKHLKSFREGGYAYFSDGVLIEARTASDVGNKLIQLSGGAIKIGEDKYKFIDAGPRFEVLEELIEQAEHKIVIMCAYRGILKATYNYLSTVKKPRSQKNKYTVDYVDGSVTGVKRHEKFQKFMDSKGYRILVCHPQTVAFGTELAAADMLIFNGPPMSGDFVYAQALERLSSPEQKGGQISIRHVYSTSEEKAMFDRLEKGHTASMILHDMFAAATKRATKERKLHETS